MSEPRYPFVRVDVPEEIAEEASGLLFELGAEGVEERDTTTLSKGTPGQVTLVAAFADHASASEAISAIDAEWNPTLEEVIGDAWRDAWKEFYHPFSLTPRLTVRPPWEPYTPVRPDEQVLELEPGRAFGTGLHATTSLVAHALDRAAARLHGARVLDVGTGSGILALVALRLGASSVVAIDSDPDAIEVTRENAVRNQLAERVEPSVTPVEELTERFPVVVANIEARVLIPMAKALTARVQTDGLLVLSGILAGQEDDVSVAYASLGPARLERQGEWLSLTFGEA